MSLRMASALGTLLVLGLVGTAQASVKPWLCPPKQFDSVANFDLAKFISAPWYVQKQLPVASQPADSLYCVRAKYSPLDAKNLAKGVKVCNYANQGGINKTPVGTCLAKNSGPDMSALAWPVRRSDPTTAASKLLVGLSSKIAGKSADDLAKPPPPGQARLAGPYWVVAVGPSKTASLGYDWAIVSGGAPSQATENDACLPSDKNGDGLWLFSRTPVAPKAQIDAMLAAAAALRLDTAALVDVKQTGCTYAGAA